MRYLNGLITILILMLPLLFAQCSQKSERKTTNSNMSSNVTFSETSKMIKSTHSVDKTAENLQKALMDKGMNIFVTVKHHQGAKAAGLELRPTTTVVFGNPKLGTTLMQCSQTSGIDQPMKALIWEDDSGDVWLAYNTIEYLTQRHGTADCLDDSIKEKIAAALENFAQKATQ